MTTYPIVDQKAAIKDWRASGPTEAEIFAVRQLLRRLSHDPESVDAAIIPGMALPKYVTTAFGTSVTVAYYIMKSPPYEFRALLISEVHTD